MPFSIVSSVIVAEPVRDSTFAESSPAPVLIVGFAIFEMLRFVVVNVIAVLS